MALEQTISVVIPLYNKRDYIVRTVESVLNQSYHHLELIIVNDGSTDDSLEQLNSLQDSRIKIITQANAGEGAARNKGLKAANHEWIAFLDADDSWEPDFLRCITQMLDAHPDIELCATGYKIRGPNDAETVGDLNASEFELQDNYFALSFENKLPFCASSVVIAPTASAIAPHATMAIPSINLGPATSEGAPSPIKTTPIKARAAPDVRQTPMRSPRKITERMIEKGI